MAIDVAPEFGIPFTLTGPDGTVVKFNSAGDPDDVGLLTDIKGLDSAEVRDSGEDLVEFDGAIQGPNWFGARPVTIEGLVYGHSTATQRQAKLAKLQRACKALREDATLSWTPTGTSMPVYLKLRTQLPLRISGAWNKTFVVGMVARDPRIYSEELFIATDYAGADMEITNEGSAETFPVYTIMGPQDDVIVTNVEEESSIVTSADLALEDALVIDTMRRTVYSGERLPGERRNLYRDPSFEGVLTTLTGTPTSPASSFDRHASQPSPSSGYGSKVMKWTNGTGGAAMVSLKASPSTDYFVVPTSGSRIIVGFSAHASALDTTYKPRIVLERYNSSGSFVETQTYNFSSFNSVGWSRHTNASSPMTTSGANDRIYVYIGCNQSGTPTLSTVDLYFDAITVEKMTPTEDLVDGSFFYPNGEDTFWAGTANDSETYQIHQEIDPDTELVPNFAVVDFALTRWTGLMPGENTITTGLPPGGEDGAFFRAEWRHAWL